MFGKQLVKANTAFLFPPMRSSPAKFPCHVRSLAGRKRNDLIMRTSFGLKSQVAVANTNSRFRNPPNHRLSTCHHRNTALWRTDFEEKTSLFQGIRVKAETKSAPSTWDIRREVHRHRPLQYCHDELKQNFSSRFGGESRQEGFFINCSSVFGLLLLFIFASNKDNEKGDCCRAIQKEESIVNGFASMIRRWKSLFVVSAAVPIDEDNASNCGDKKPPFSRRKYFNFIADVVHAVQPAVVCIEVKDHSTVNWFGMPQASSNGSGFIVKEDGLILTNAHVVVSNQNQQQRCSISVKLPDGRCFTGYVEAVDYESDLATVRVNARGLPTLRLGCSADTRMGEWVVAVGSPLNLSNTVTAGIVSCTRKGSELGIHVNDINYIQTDAAITFGNSGGPLINLDGEAIGINSMKVTPGISFAIPIDHAKTFLEKAELRRSTGKSILSRRYMGLTILSLTEEIRRELQIRTGMYVVDQGVFVWQVVRGGPAFLAGLQPGDVITNINGKPMSSAAQVHEIIKTDDNLVVQVQRGNFMLTFTIVPETVS